MQSNQADNSSNVITALAALVLLPFGLAQASDDNLIIKLSSRNIDPAAEVEKSGRGIDQAILSARSSRIVLQFHELPTEDERQRLAKAGISLLEYVPDNAWFASVAASVDLKRVPTGLIRWVGAVQPGDKISPALRSAGVGKWAFASDGSVTLHVVFFRDAEWDEISALLDKHQAEYVSGYDNGNFVVRFADVSVIKRLAREDIVQWIDNGPPPRYPRDLSNGQRPARGLMKNDVARDITRVNALQATVPGAVGTGTRLAVFDGGVDPDHPDFAGRITVDPNHSQPAEFHGTHVAGTMAGDGSNSQGQGGTADQYRGVATGAQILSFDNQADYFASHQDAIQSENADLSQNSWGGYFTSQVCDTHNIYSIDSRNMDRIVTGEAWGRGIVVSVAASNFRSGDSDDQADPSPAPICDFDGAPDFVNYTSLSDLGSAKNILSVGATQKVATDRMADFSSWGPTRDGRLKPDIVAPGEGIQSTVPGGGYGDSSGTSMSTPHVSGIAALVIQRYREVFDETPLPATVRSILIHAARDLDDHHVYYTAGPDFASGYGMADAEAAYAAVGANTVLQHQVAHGALYELSIVVAGNPSELKVTLTWDDPAAALNAATQLVNNLDLDLVAPNGTTLHLPWVLDPADPGAAATRGVDTRNNSEQVLVENPASGTWRLRVKGTAIPVSPQRFSLTSSHALQSDVVFVNGFEP
jgi:subtilisin family serine protease